jgi:hypothetical protein
MCAIIILNLSSSRINLVKQHLVESIYLFLIQLTYSLRLIAMLLVSLSC